MNESPGNPNGLRDLTTMAASCGVSRQAFHRWQIEPEAAEGKRRLFSLAAVLDNRLNAAQQASTPADAELDRLDARAALLQEQIEAARIRNVEDAARYVPADAAADALAAILAGVAGVVERITDDVLAEFPDLEPKRDLIETEIGKATAALQSVRIETDNPEAEAVT